MAFRKSLLVLCAGLSLAAAGKSPHAKVAEAMFASSVRSGRISDNVIEDAILDVPDLVRKYNYPFEEHNVTTSDGYILTMHRIPYGRDNYNVTGSRPVVFIMHGLLCSSADFIVLGPGSALAYILAEEGFDVWLGNSRGNFYSRSHTDLNPDGSNNSDYWKFSWDEIGNIDLPAMIDYALSVTGLEGLHYIGHSMGTTTFFVMGSLRPEYNAKIISMHALAPVAYMEYNQNIILRALSINPNSIELLLSTIGIYEFLPKTELMTWAGIALCQDQEIFQPLCSTFIYVMGGGDGENHNATILPIIFGHYPAGSSARNFVHYAQEIKDNRFRRYDHGNWLANRNAYGSWTPPNYNLSMITSPVFLHYSDQDPLAAVKDVERLFQNLGRPMGMFRVPLATYNHYDYLWGMNGRELVYDRVIELIKAMDQQEFVEIEPYLSN